MKIISLEGENLASLAAPFYIDFSSGILADAGLFAICGNTGSGKSTLLDAICLGLFDAMPRFSSSGRGAAIGHAQSDEKERLKSNDVRHILTRGAANGFAQVTFELDNGNRYVARWSVKRSRNSAQGRFQAQEMQLTDGRTNQVLATKKTEVLTQIETLIGLNYEQFKRSVLLAQGDFAAFLKAPAKERSQLLERITGTELYSQLSKSAFDKAKEHEQKLLLLQSKIGEIQPLSHDEQHNITQELNRVNQAIADINEQHKLLTWLEDVLGQKQRLDELVEDQAQALLNATRAIEQRAINDDQLEKIEQAQQARVVYVQRRQQEQEKQAQKNQLIPLEHQRKQEQNTLETTQQESDQLEQLRLQAHSDYERKLPDIELATTKLIELNALQQQLSNTAEQWELLEQQHVTNVDKVDANKLKNEELTVELHAVETHLTAHHYMAPIAKQWEVIQQNIQGYRQDQEFKLAHQAHLTVNQQETQQATQALNELNHSLAGYQNHYQDLQQQLTQYAQTFKTDSLEQLELTLAAHQENQLLLSNEQQLIVQGLQYQSMIAQKQQQHQSIECELIQLRQSYFQCKQQLEHHLPVLNEAEKSLNSAKQIMSLNDHRVNLINGEACALCGSTEHPYSRGVNVADELILQLANRHQQLEKQAQQYQQQLTQYDVMGNQKGEQLQQLTQEIQEISQLIKQLNTHDISLERQGEVERQLVRVLHDIEQLRSQIKQVTEWVKQAQEIEQQAIQQQHEITTTEQEAINLKDRLVGIANEISRTQQTLAQYEQQQQRRLDWLTEVYNRVQWHEILDSEEQIAAFESQLIDEVDAYEQAQEKKINLSNQSVNLKQEMEFLTEQARQLALQSTPLQAQFQQEQTRFTQESKAIEQLMQGKDPAIVKQQLLNRIEEITQANTNATNQLTLLNNRLLVTQSEITQIENRLSEIDSQENRLEQQWLEWQTVLSLTETGLVELLNYEQGWLKEQREIGAKLLQQQQQAQAVLQAQKLQLIDVEQLLVARSDELTTLFPTLAPSPLLSSVQQRAMVLALIEAEMATLNQGQFECRSQLEQHQQAMVRFGELQLKIDEQYATTTLWKNMKDLIGAADGAKFRAFAQSLTLEQMLVSANYHLDDLAPRYSLQRVPHAELELQMIDKNMGDEIRSIDSLSGGETFLVSLALALGLGSLTSLQTTIKSLFIDEGFGTLDPDTLEVALSCLDSLQASGRQIGIISHVQGLVERVGTRIQITPNGNGHSSLELLVR